MTASATTKRILMFAPACFPPAQPEAIVNAKLVLALQQAGWSVDVIAEAAAAGQWYPNRPAAWADLRDCVHLVPPIARGGVRDLWTAFRSFFRSGQYRGGFRWALPAAMRAMELARSSPYDLVLSRAIPDDAHLAALMFCRRTGVPWVANWNDPLPWPKFPPPYGDGPQAVMPWWYERYLRALARYGSWYTFPCERMRRYMMGYLPPGMASRSSVIPHVAMRRFVVPPRQHEGFVVCHAGSLRRPRDPRVLLEGARRFAERLAPGHAFSLRFIVEKPDEALAAARAARAEHLVRVDPPRPYDAMPEALAEADVLVVVEAPLAEGIFLPSKFVDYVQSGRPILALSPREGTLSDLLRDHGGGLAVDGQSPEAVADALVRLYDAWRQGTLDAKFGSAHLFDQFSEERVAALYADLFAHVAASPVHGTGA